MSVTDYLYTQDEKNPIMFPNDAEHYFNTDWTVRKSVKLGGRQTDGASAVDTPWQTKGSAQKQAFHKTQ